jgi:hypothetical protein
MRAMLVLVLFVLGCGGERAAHRQVPAPRNAAAPTPTVDAGATVVDAGAIGHLHCCVGDSWMCASAPPAGDPCGISSGGCCQGDHWTCNRLPRKDECPGAPGMREP